MRYDIHYNHITNIWVVWEITDGGNTQTVVKRFKTEKAAKNWIAKHK